MTLIKRVIHQDQVGFIVWMHGSFHIHKFIKVTHYINRMKGKKPSWSSQYMSKKAIEKIKHSFIIKTLNKIGLENVYLNTIKNRFTNPQLTSYATMKT